MAGGFGLFKGPKDNKTLIKKNNSEILKDFPDSSSSKPKIKSSGILFPGQSLNLKSGESKTNINWNREFLIKSAPQEQTVFINHHTQEIKKEIEALRTEIKKLVQSTNNLDQAIIQSVDQNIVEFSQYQITFLERIKNLVVQFRQNIDQSCVWMESFNRKKSRKNAFWNKAKSKNGGEQYLFSGEHSASRSAN
jgi:hypothetical protein